MARGHRVQPNNGGILCLWDYILAAAIAWRRRLHGGGDCMAAAVFVRQWSLNYVIFDL
jgi:hypothetical protein